MSKKTDVPPPSAEVLRQQLQIANDENRRLRARLEAGTNAPSLAIDVAEAIQDGRQAAAASPPGGKLDDVRSRQRPGSHPPTRDRAAASALRGLESAVGRAVSTYWSRRNDDWQRPVTVREGTEKVRCRNRDCSRLDRRTPRYIRVGASSIELGWCPECGSRMTT